MAQVDTAAVVDLQAAATPSSARATRLFAGCFAAMFATSFAFIVRALVITDWGNAFALTEAQKGAIFPGAALFPFAISIVLFSLFIDRIGYGRIMVFAFAGHVVGTVVTILAATAHTPAAAYQMLYFGTLITSLANGAVEAVVNPVTATLYPHNKTHHLNILHAGWPGGLVLAGILTILMGNHFPWTAKIGLVLLPTLIYAVLLFGQKFPLQERVAAGVSYSDMMREFGAAGAFILAWFLTMAFLTVAGVFLSDAALASGGWERLNNLLPPIVAVVCAIAFFAAFRSFGRPMFILLLGIMILSATTELGTNGWITDLLTPAFGRNAGWLLVYTSALMFVMRFFAGPIVHKLNPIGLLCTCSAIATIGLLWIGSAGDQALMIFLAATLFGIGTAFFWPTTLGLVAEQFPRGGAMTLNAIGGMGMIAVGVLGGAVLGAMMDNRVDARLAAEVPAIHEKVAGKPDQRYFMSYRDLNQAAVATLPADEQKTVATIQAQTKQGTLRTVAVLPAIMFLCYAGLALYFRSRGGYKVQRLAMTGEEASGGVEGPVR
jgi:MFS family permease